MAGESPFFPPFAPFLLRGDLLTRLASFPCSARLNRLACQLYMSHFDFKGQKLDAAIRSVAF